MNKFIEINPYSVLIKIKLKQKQNLKINHLQKEPVTNQLMVAAILETE